VAGGIDGVVVRPALAIAAGCERLERWLYNAALAVGRATLSLGQSADRTDSDGIDAAIFGLVDRTVALGARARRLQSGFIHRELAITAIGIAIIIVALFAAPYLV
jgi:NADH-quinone oxidoreductase subunit L